MNKEIETYLFIITETLLMILALEVTKLIVISLIFGCKLSFFLGLFGILLIFIFILKLFMDKGVVMK